MFIGVLAGLAVEYLLWLNYTSGTPQYGLLALLLLPLVVVVLVGRTLGSGNDQAQH
jgi:hypothetical protein